MFSERDAIQAELNRPERPSILRIGVRYCAVILAGCVIGYSVLKRWPVGFVAGTVIVYCHQVRARHPYWWRATSLMGIAPAVMDGVFHHTTMLQLDSWLAVSLLWCLIFELSSTIGRGSLEERLWKRRLLNKPSSLKVAASCLDPSFVKVEYGPQSAVT